jgi:hypothetical protein
VFVNRVFMRDEKFLGVVARDQGRALEVNLTLRFPARQTSILCIEMKLHGRPRRRLPFFDGDVDVIPSLLIRVHSALVFHSCLQRHPTSYVIL